MIHFANKQVSDIHFIMTQLLMMHCTSKEDSVDTSNHEKTTTLTSHQSLVLIEVEEWVFLLAMLVVFSGQLAVILTLSMFRSAVSINKNMLDTVFVPVNVQALAIERNKTEARFIVLIAFTQLIMLNIHILNTGDHDYIQCYT